MWNSPWGWGRAHGPSRWAWGWWTPGYRRSSPCNRCGQCPSRRWSLEQGSDWPTCPALPEYWPMKKGWHILYITFVLPFFPTKQKNLASYWIQIHRDMWSLKLLKNTVLYWRIWMNFHPSFANGSILTPDIKKQSQTSIESFHKADWGSAMKNH